MKTRSRDYSGQKGGDLRSCYVFGLLRLVCLIGFSSQETRILSCSVLFCSCDRVVLLVCNVGSFLCVSAVGVSLDCPSRETRVLCLMLLV